MPFFKTLGGGIAIVVIATAIGIVQNAFRDRSLPLKPSSRKPANLAPADPLVGDRAGSTDAPAGGAANSSPGDSRGATTEPAAVTSGTSGSVTPDEIASGEVTKERLKDVMASPGVVLIDARGTGEFAEGHLPGAINVPYENFIEHYDALLSEVPMDAVVIVYCRSLTCDLSDQLAQELQIAGYQNVVLYRGGWDEWTEAGFPTE